MDQVTRENEREAGPGKDDKEERGERGPAGFETDSEGMPVQYATTGSHPALTALAVGLVIVLAIAVAAYGTMVIDIGLPPVPGATYPYSTTYSVVIPPGQQVLIAGVPMVVVDAGETLKVVLERTPEQFAPGEPHTIARGTAETRSLGFVLSHTGYQVDAVYLGAEGDSADLSLTILTTERASSRLVKALLPTGVEIFPG
ncbi:hypothetical protein J2741_001210 [Methanolinea mesophila]|uniref:hypothetical protein n=1 Tax=Methanolinea mesophila TaxID=547055 RepID=UPI001AE59BE7|nr:hypothetical protein [Methanolinea mesophila]MBP1928663.1 hypothetical protein [Methanolinea mesophila]